MPSDLEMRRQKPAAGLIRMIRAIFRITAYSVLLSGAGCFAEQARAAAPQGMRDVIQITNVHQIRLHAAQLPAAVYYIRLDGEVLWVDAMEGELLLKDGSGTEELDLDLHGEPLAAGQMVHLEGYATITATGAGFRVGVKGPVVDNDGVHDMLEKSGSVYLKAGRNPLRVEWFNGVEKYGLKVEYQGPNLPRQEIPDAALFRLETGTSNWVNGLDYVCVEAHDETLPDFDKAAVLKTGTTSHFDLTVIPQQEHVGLRFSGFLETPREGLYTFYTTSDDGSRLFAGRSLLQLKVMGQAPLPAPEPLAVVEYPTEKLDNQFVQVEGKVTFISTKADGLKLELMTAVGRMRAEIAGANEAPSASLLNHRVQVRGFYQRGCKTDDEGISGVLLVPGSQNISPVLPMPGVEYGATNAGHLPILTTASEIHRLKREDADRGYPVRIQGVITSVLPEHQAFTIQDSTRGIYVVDQSDTQAKLPRIGDFLKVEGATASGQFAPVVNARNVEDLGVGNLPEPVHPTRDQLVNGSLDAQYVEIQGVVTSVQTNNVTLLTPDGRIQAELRVTGIKPENIKAYEDALVRLRGCLFANWNYLTHEVKGSEIRLYGADIEVDQPAPADPFAIPGKTVAQLFLFDPQASAFQRVKVSGQIIHLQMSDGFIMNGKNGLHFIAKQMTGLGVGDLVEVVGFPELASGSPILREAQVRKTGHALLPEPQSLSSEDLARTDLDSTRVRVKAILVSRQITRSGPLLEMRAGLRPFLALLPKTSADMMSIPAGSQLELTGTYTSQGVSQDAASFGLLLNSPDDIVVLARPPWWTLKKMLFILGALACVLVATVLWITQLRRQVGQRTAELETQIRERQRLEQQRAMEQERTRIAQDLHDELGSGLTEITMLGARAGSASVTGETRSAYVEQMSDKARDMVIGLDEIVWAMNPTHDSLASMISYFSLYAERFLGLADVAWRLESPFVSNDCPVDSRHRHQLFLAFKEALNNVVRHSGATEVRVNIQTENGRVRLVIADNGRGWAEAGRTPAMDGVANMRARLEKMGGRFEIQSKPGQGTTVCFDLPAN